MKKQTLQSALLSWYQANRRDLPWRGETDPYRILLSEVLLQQTRVDQAIPYYHRFLQVFPSLQALGLASQEEVLKVWQGAGYYSRARNLHKLAQLLATTDGAVLPETYEELVKLPGLGAYTAAAVASIAFGESVAAVDGNVRRVISRLMAWTNPTAKQVQDVANSLLLASSASEWNQAMMELGSSVCTPKSPRCEACPIGQWCKGRVNATQYPQPKVRLQKSLELVALVLMGKNGVYLSERTGRVLGGMWGVPMEENPGGLERLLNQFGLSQAQYAGEVRHAFTHRKLRVLVYCADSEASEQPSKRPLSELDRKILRCAGLVL